LCSVKIVLSLKKRQKKTKKDRTEVKYERAPTGFDGIWKLNQARERREKARGERKRMTT